VYTTHEVVLVSDRIQIGPTIDKDVWERFREHVKDQHGKTRGSLGDELENAIRHYINFGSGKPLPEQFAEFNQRLDRIEGAVGTAEADGGHTSERTEHTHTPSRIDEAATEKPGANAATEKKVSWLAEKVIEAECPKSRELNQLPRERLLEVVREEYGFRRDTAKRYVDELIHHFDLREHPRTDAVLMTQDAYEEFMERERENLADEADEVLS